MEKEMASSKERVAYVIEQLNIATGGNVSSRAMMGEYVVYYRDKVIGGIYDDRLLVKVTDSSRALLANVSLEIPYAGAKEMLKIENVEDAAAIKELFEAMYPELPARKTKKKQS
jgi:TfoX/Sxy family transcriptional regulator of competence genes